MKILRNLLIGTLIIFVSWAAFHTIELYSEHAHMKVLGTLSQITYENQNINFADAHKDFINLFIFVSVLLLALTWAAHKIGKKSQKMQRLPATWSPKCYQGKQPLQNN
jgi:hypothetical protein